jgi:hypothetical protein
MRSCTSGRTPGGNRGQHAYGTSASGCHEGAVDTTGEQSDSDPTLSSTMVISTDAATLSWAALVALGVSALVSGLVKFVFDDLLAKRKANRDFEYERRRELRALLALFDGRLMEAAADLHYRFRNIYISGDSARLWLQSPTGYFCRSTVYRFLALFRLAVEFDQRAIYFEPETCSADDLMFIRYAKAFQWAMTDTRLFEGTGYDVTHATDHFFRDNLRTLCEVDLPPEQQLTYAFFERQVVPVESKQPLFEFFAGLSKESTPFRWDRLVILDLLLMGFLDRVGYDDLYTQDQEAFDATGCELLNQRIGDNARGWVKERKLNDPESIERITHALRANDDETDVKPRG